MEGVQGTTASTACTAGGGSSGPAPFLLKTYDMVDDSSTDEIVSWSSSKTSFVVWNPPEFARLLLPTYFKHNNFSSFIRQLNTYGFRKIDSEKWEFANEDFVKDQKHLLKNIHRRKPIHSHSQPQGPLIDPERSGFEEEIEQLSRDKAALEAKVSSFKEQRSSAKLQFDELSQRIGSIEKRQESLLIYVEKAFKNPTFIEHFAQRVESIDFAAYNKKRRLPEVTCLQSAVDGSFVDTQSNSKSEFGNIFDRDFSSKLRLELSPAVSIINLVSNSAQSSNEDGGTLHRKTSEDEGRAQMRTEGIGAFMTEALELSDTETSFGFKMDSSLSRKLPTNGSPRLQSLQPNMTFNEEGDGQVACHLNLTLASSSLQVSNNPYSAKISLPGQEPNKTTDLRFSGNSKEPDVRISAEKNNITNEQKHSSSKEDVSTNHGSVPAKANDFFWEQFLTERPGCSENEEASSNYRSKTYDDQDDGRLGCGMSRSARNVEQLKL